MAVISIRTTYLTAEYLLMLNNKMAVVCVCFVHNFNNNNNNNNSIAASYGIQYKLDGRTKQLISITKIPTILSPK